MKISVIGTGYVGLVSGACLSEKGHEVVCVDIDSDKVFHINSAIPPIYEEGLEELLKKNIGSRLRATTNLHEAVIETDVSLIAVGTPFNGNEIDLSYIKQVSRQIGESLRHKNTYHVVIVKSTVVPGTTDTVVLPILEKHSGKEAGADFGVGMNPEFLKEGEAIADFMHPDRIVFGGMDEKTHKVQAEIYRPFQGIDVIKTNNKTAEMIKYASNSLLATMISFSNELGNMCASLGGIDAKEVMVGVHLDKRLSPILADGKRIVSNFTTYLDAGCGFGGSCFPKDVKALIQHGKKKGNTMQLLDAVIKVNEKQPGQVLRLLGKHFSSLKDVRISVLGLAFKPGTDDMRESPAIPIIRELLRQDAIIKAYDPVAENEARKLFDNNRLRYSKTLSEAIADVEAVLLLTRWREFDRIPEIFMDMKEQPLLIDGRRMIDKTSVKKYEGIGL